MAVDGETPKAGRGFKHLNRTLFKYGPMRLSELTLAGNRLRAIASTRSKRR